MREELSIIKRRFYYAASLLCFLIFIQEGKTQQTQLTQQTQITEYVIFGGQKTSIPPQTAPLSPGYAVQLGSSCNIQGGCHR